MLLPRLFAFFASALIDPTVSPHVGWFSFEGVPLKWQHPVGLLYDLFAGQEPSTASSPGQRGHLLSEDEAKSSANATQPWKLLLHFTDWPTDQLIPLDASMRVQHDAFINSVKEADFLRNGTGRTIMSLSKDDSTKLWQAVEKHDLPLFNSINHKFIHPPDGLALRHVPVKVYLPSAIRIDGSNPARGTIKVVQGLFAPTSAMHEPQTLGMALHNLLPTVFPSRRSYIYAQAVLHGAVVPSSAPLQDLLVGAAYPDGFLHIVVTMVS